MSLSPDQINTYAISMHEIYESYKRAGFTESQALYLIGTQIAAASAPPKT